MDRGAWQATVHGVARVGHDLATKPPPPPCIYNTPTEKCPKQKYTVQQILIQSIPV